MIRTDARQEYGEVNTIFGMLIPTRFFQFKMAHSLIFTVTRIQFYAFEIARNRLGLNDGAHEIAKAEAEKEAKEKVEKAAAKAAKGKKSVKS